MKKFFLLSLLAILTLTASAQTNTYAMVIEMQNGTKLTIGPNEVKNVTFNNGELTVTGETIETLVASAVNQAKEYTDQSAANLKAYIDLSRELAELKASSEAADTQLSSTIDANKAAQSEKNSSFEKAIEAIKKALGDDTAATLKAYAKSIANSGALQAKLDAQSYADTRDAAQSQTLLSAIADQAEQDQKAWTAAINTCVDNLVKTYQLNALSEIISARIDEAIVNLIQTYNLQKQ